MEKEINTDAERIINQLYRIASISAFNWFRQKNLQPSELNEMEELTDIFPFIPLIFVKNKQVSAFARQKVRVLFAQIPMTRLANFDEKLRRYFYPEYYKLPFNYWYGLKSSIIAKMNSDRLIDIKILCCHPDGYVRFGAIRALATMNVVQAIPLLLLRANDWVDGIREFCHGALIQAINDKALCFILLESIPLLAQLKNKRRSEQFQLTQQIESALLRHCSEALFKQLESQDYVTARYAFSMLASANDQTDRLLDVTLHHRKDIIIKVNAFNLAKTHYDANHFLNYLSILVNDRFMAIRKKALYALIELYPEHAKKYLEMALLDRSETIRNIGRYYLAKNAYYAQK